MGNRATAWKDGSVRALSALAAALVCALAGCGRPAPSPAAFLPARTPSPLFDPALAEALLEAPDRDRWQKPAEIIRALNIRSGMTVADVGAGSGYLLPHLSRAVGPEGVVLAEEIQDAFIPRLRRAAKTLANIRIIRGTAADPRLPARGVDRFVLLTVYHEVDDPVRFLRTLHRAAKPGARLAIIDFDIARGGRPPAPPGHELPESDVIAEAGAAGWEFTEKHEFLSSQFVLVFRQSARGSAREQPL